MHYGSSVLKGLSKKTLRALFRDFRTAAMARAKSFETEADFDRYIYDLVRPQNDGIVAARDLVIAAAGYFALTWARQPGSDCVICGQPPRYTPEMSRPYVEEIYRRHGVTIPPD